MQEIFWLLRFGVIIWSADDFFLSFEDKEAAVGAREIITSMDLCSYRKANRNSSDQENLSVLRNPEVHYPVGLSNSLPL